MCSRGSVKLTHRSFCEVIVTCLVLWLVCLQPLAAQITTARLSGNILDATGAKLADAVITATKTDTATSASTVSDLNGRFQFLSLASGEYTLTVEHPGFKVKKLSGIQLLVAQQANLDISLEVGQVTTTVDVSGVVPLIDTSTASVGTVVESEQVVELPLNARRYGSLATLVPGTTTDPGGFASSATGSAFSETTYNASGARDSSNDYLVDGIEARNLSFGGFSVQPTPDGVQEFRLQTTVYSAAFGRTAGSVINLVTKSGSNQFHGSVYEFLRNDLFDATNYFSTVKPEYRRNQFGFAVGGPIQKGKTFFFANLELLRQIQGQSLTSVVPTQAQRAGDFSGLLTGSTTNLCGTGGPANINYDTGQLFDPSSESTLVCPSGAKAGSTVLVGTPIAGNVLGSIDPTAQKVLNLFPLPNRSGAINFVDNASVPRNDYILQTRVDHTIGANDQLFGRYMFGQSKFVEPLFLPGFGFNLYYRGQNVALGWTHTFTPHLLNEVHLGFQRNTDIESCEGCPKAPGTIASFGINNLTGFGPQFESDPLFILSNYTYAGNFPYHPQDNNDMVETYQDNLTWTHGRHTIVVGADMQFWQAFRVQAPYSANGLFTYSGSYSSLDFELPDAGHASDLADLETGTSPTYAARSFAFKYHYQNGGGIWSQYVQDDIKVSRNLTINAGLRYEYRRPAVDKNNAYAAFYPLGPKFSGLDNAVLITAQPDSVNDAYCTDPQYSYLHASDGQCLVASSALRRQLGFTGRTARTLIFPDKDDFAPRLGFAWRPTKSDRLVVRGGVGIFYDLPILNNQHFGDNNPISAPSQTFNATFGEPPAVSIHNVFGSAAIPNVDSQFLGLYVTPFYKTPRYTEWSFGTETSLGRGSVLEINYIGNSGEHLTRLHDFGNQPEPGLGPLQPRRPYPAFNTTLYTDSDANANYNSLQAKFTKRFSGGLSLLASYTLAHAIDDAEGDEGGGVGLNPQDDNNLAAERARSANDARNRFVFSYVYELPFGKNRRFLNQGPALNAILGGWAVSGIASFQSGFPITVLSIQDFSNTGSNSPRPDRICNGAGPHRVDDWFNASCFSTTVLQDALQSGQPRFGDSGRDILDGPGIQNFDFALLRRFSLWESRTLEFRAESFNLANHPNFGQPNATYGSALFGQIASAAAAREIQFALKFVF